MRNIRLGRAGLEVSAIGMGCLPMSKFYGQPPEREQSAKVLHRALDIGVNFLDTANAYGWGHNESLIGEVLSGRRSEAIIATKFGHVRTDSGVELCGRPEHVKQACDASLKYLQTDYIDLYYMHRLDPKVPVEDTVGAMAELVAAGKVRYLGLSEVSAKTLRRAHAVHPISAVESEYSLWTRDPETHVMPACRELGVGLVPFAPLGRGILTATLNPSDTFGKGDIRRILPRFQSENYAANLRVVAPVAELAADKGCTPAQLALAWLLAQGDFISPIPGTERMAYLEENAGAAEVVLTSDDLHRIDALIRPTEVAGGRYDAQSERFLDRDD